MTMCLYVLVGDERTPQHGHETQKLLHSVAVTAGRDHLKGQVFSFLPAAMGQI